MPVIRTYFSTPNDLITGIGILYSYNINTYKVVNIKSYFINTKYIWIENSNILMSLPIIQY